MPARGLDAGLTLSALWPVRVDREHAEMCVGVLKGPNLEVALITSGLTPLARTQQEEQENCSSLSRPLRFSWGLYKCMRTENRIHAKLKLVELK